MRRCCAESWSGCRLMGVSQNHARSKLGRRPHEVTHMMWATSHNQARRGRSATPGQSQNPLRRLLVILSPRERGRLVEVPRQGAWGMGGRSLITIIPAQQASPRIGLDHPGPGDMCLKRRSRSESRDGGVGAFSAGPSPPPSACCPTAHITRTFARPRHNHHGSPPFTQFPIICQIQPLVSSRSVPGDGR